MNISDITKAVLKLDGATMARANKTNFVMIPTEDGYAKVEIKAAMMKDTKNHAAFNAEAAVAEYKTWEADSALKAAERATRPPKGPSPDAQKRRDELDAKISALPAFAGYTATDIRNALAGQIADNVTVMAVGSSARRLVERGVVTMEVTDNKPHYTKA